MQAKKNKQKSMNVAAKSLDSVIYTETEKKLGTWTQNMVNGATS